MRSVTKAMPIKFVHGKCHIKKWKAVKLPYPVSYYACLSHNLFLIPLEADTHRHTPTFADETISRNQAHVDCRPMWAWFKIIVY